jgi:hypothetical protein
MERLRLMLQVCQCLVKRSTQLNMPWTGPSCELGEHHMPSKCSKDTDECLIMVPGTRSYILRLHVQHRGFCSEHPLCTSHYVTWLGGVFQRTARPPIKGSLPRSNTITMSNHAMLVPKYLVWATRRNGGWSFRMPQDCSLQLAACRRGSLWAWLCLHRWAEFQRMIPDTARGKQVPTHLLGSDDAQTCNETLARFFSLLGAQTAFKLLPLLR